MSEDFPSREDELAEDFMLIVLAENWVWSKRKGYRGYSLRVQLRSSSLVAFEKA